MANNDFSGIWYSYHWYPTKDDTGEESSEYEVTAHQTGDQVVFESAKNGDSYMLIRVNVEGDVLSGSWHESSKPDGEFKGAMYSGAGQMLMSDDHNSMEGMWAGAGFDHQARKSKIYTGRWALSRTKR